MNLYDKIDRSRNLVGQIRIAIMVNDWKRVEQSLDELDALLFEASEEADKPKGDE